MVSPKGILVVLRPVVFYVLAKEPLLMLFLLTWAFLVSITQLRSLLRHAAARGFSHFLVQFDSLMVVNCFLGKNHIPQKLDCFIQELKLWVQKLQIKVLYIFRETNTATNALANHSRDTASSHMFSTLEDLSS